MLSLCSTPCSLRMWEQSLVVASQMLGRRDSDFLRRRSSALSLAVSAFISAASAFINSVAIWWPPDAFVVGDVAPEALIDYVARQLSVHKRPREVRIVDALPRNAMGKVLKKELRTWG